MSQEQSKKLYSLKLLFDRKQIAFDELKEKAEYALSQYLPDITFKISLAHGGTSIELKGSLEVVDKCHDNIHKSLIKPLEIKCLRILDEVGDEIRQKAYPILAEIEQRFRVFISQALVEVCGFDWWDTLAPVDMRNKVQSIRDKHQEEGMLLDPLECTQFDDLITIITAEVSEWTENQSLSISEILEIMSDCDSFTDVKNYLKDKIKKFSFWDIFSRFFEDRKKWEEIKKTINFIINVRHKVMHHRPIRLGVINALLDKKQEIFTLLDTAKPELSEEERTEAQEDVKDIRKTVSTQKKDSNLSLIPSNSLLAQKQRAELVLQFDAVAEILQKQASKELAQFNAVTEMLRKQSSKELAQLNAIIESSRKQNLSITAPLDAIIEPLRKQNLAMVKQINAITEPLQKQNSEMVKQMNALIEPLRKQKFYY